MAIQWRNINISGKWYQAKLALHGAFCGAWSFDILPSASKVFVILDVFCQVLYWRMLPYLNMFNCSVLVFLNHEGIVSKAIILCASESKIEVQGTSFVINPTCEGHCRKRQKTALEDRFKEGFSDSSSKTGLVGNLFCLWKLLIEKGKLKLHLGSSEIRPIDPSHPEIEPLCHQPAF